MEIHENGGKKKKKKSLLCKPNSQHGSLKGVADMIHNEFVNRFTNVAATETSSRL